MFRARSGEPLPLAVGTSNAETRPPSLRAHGTASGGFTTTGKMQDRLAEEIRHGRKSKASMDTDEEAEGTRIALRLGECGKHVLSVSSSGCGIHPTAGRSRPLKGIFRSEGHVMVRGSE